MGRRNRPCDAGGGVNPIIEAELKGLGEAVGLLHMVKSIIYDGENDMTRRLCVRLEREIMERMAELKAKGLGNVSKE